MINKEELKQIIKDLERPFFHSEADFQHSLAWRIKEVFPKAQIRLERPFKVDDKIFYLDLFLELQGEKIGIELKYKTKKLNKNLQDEEYNLKDQGAWDWGRYDFCKDIFRIEKLIEKGYLDKGFAIFLTNDDLYFQDTNRACDKQFRLFQDRKIRGNLNWHPDPPKWTSGRGEISIKGEYNVSWEEHNEEHDFKILIIEIGKQRNP